MKNRAGENETLGYDPLLSLYLWISSRYVLSCCFPLTFAKLHGLSQQTEGIKEIIIIIKIEDGKKEFFKPNSHISWYKWTLFSEGSWRRWIGKSILNWAITAKRPDRCWRRMLCPFMKPIWLFAVFSVRFKSTVKFPQEWHLFKPMRVFVPVMRRRQVDRISKFQRLLTSF